jgi:hypothetical protein
LIRLDGKVRKGMPNVSYVYYIGCQIIDDFS